MKKLIGGAICVILGVIGFTSYFPEFIGLLMGSIPVVLILAGALVIYLNYDNDSSDSDNDDETKPEPVEAEAVKPETVEPESVDTDLVESVDIAQPEGAPNFVGNSNSLVFHNPDCKFAQNIKNEVAFNTREEAIEKEYKPCGVCKP